MTDAYKSEVRDGMRIDWDVPIAMDDGLVLRADVFRPVAEGKYPALVSYGPYGKGLAFQEGYKTAWEIMVRENPDAVSGTSNQYQNWEVVDPEKWVPDGYAVRARGLARRRPLARLPRPQQRAREPRFPRLHRMDRGAAVVQRQGGAERHLLLREQPVARRGAAAAAPRRDLRVGRLGRTTTATRRATAASSAPSASTGRTCR